ncbi:upper tail fiber [Nitrososphaeria virus YSH_922147]|uniref:Upper tail fiber n=1 Tax=Nitrososphaeria virus YSH_922147 TaxID=3071323 RepID=A0A976UAR7_9CAUD|nr:upper tail fiber [Yangshan Harbor Nitrososphaeria virus]UVF62432.1 upper tail fiber [Nitrososphaeria virus YSH_922147]
MAYGAYLSLDQSKWASGDYSSSNKLTGTIYSDKDKTTALTLTGYTLTIRMFKSRWNSADYFNKEASIVSAGSGTFSYAVAQGEMPPDGRYMVKVELVKSGEQMSTLNDVYLFVRGGPHA